MSILNLYRLRGKQVKNPFENEEEKFDLTKHCSAKKIPNTGNWSQFKQVHKYIMLTCVRDLLKLEDEIIWDTDRKKAAEKYRYFKNCNVRMSSEETANLEAAYATSKLLVFHEDMHLWPACPEIPVDLKKFKTLLGLFEKQNQPVLQIEILAMFCEAFGKRAEKDVQKFLILFMSKIYSKLKSSRAQQDLDQKLSGNSELTVGDELTILNLCINYLKLSLMKDILEESATNYNYKKNFVTNDHSFNYLKSLLGNFTDDFMDVPLIVTSYQEAEEFSKTLSKICSDGLEIYNKNLDLMERIEGKCNRIYNYEDLKLYYNGFVYRQTAKFVSNLKRRVKFLEKGIKYLEELISKKMPTGAEEGDEIFSMAALFADDCYGMVWKTLRQVNDAEPTPENLEALEKAVKIRLEKGEIAATMIRSGVMSDNSFAYILFDMMFCSVVVLKDDERSSKLAQELACYILEHRYDVRVFTDHFQIDVDYYDDYDDPVGKLSRHLILRSIMTKCI